MKKRVLILTVFLAAMIHAAAGSVFGDIKLKLSFEKAPRYRTANTETVAGARLLDFEEYLVVEATYIPGVIEQKAANSKSKAIPKADPKTWLDNVVMDVLVAYPEQIGKNQMNTTYGLFEGKTYFWSIRLDGKRHTATMFVPPHLLARYINQPSEVKKNQKVNYRYSPRDFFVEVTFRTKDGKKLGQKHYGSIPKCKTPEDYERFFRKIENLTTKDKSIVKDAVLPRNCSPWAFVSPENYDMIIPTPRAVQK